MNAKALNKALVPIVDATGCVTGWTLNVTTPSTVGLTKGANVSGPITPWYDATGCVVLWTVNIATYVPPP